ncbi:tetratricopeptide repeat protein [Candidatus Saganbacteria bacterium]|nr:tetratricopeptide repeat protein [Candidatus Saganbacteria bacterium]
MKIKYFDKAVEWLFLALVFLSPVIFDRRIGIVFSLTKVTTMRILVVLILSIWAVKLLITRKHDFRRTPLDWPVLSYLLAVTVATLTSVHTVISFIGFYGRFEGLVTWYLFALIFWIALNYFRGIDKLKLIIATVAPTASIMSIYGIIQRHELDPYSWGGVVTWQRVIATIGQPNFLAAYMCMSFFLLLFFFLLPSKAKGTEGIEGEVGRRRDKKKEKIEKQKKEDWWIRYLPLVYYLMPIVLFVITIYSMTGEAPFVWHLSFVAMAIFALLFAYTYEQLPRLALSLIMGASLVLSYICIFYTQSRGGFLGFAVGLVLFILLVPREYLLKNLKKLSILAAVIVLVSAWVIMTPGNSPFARFSQEISVQSAAAEPQAQAAPVPKVKTKVELAGAAGSRGETWKSAFRIIADNPLFGIGPEVLKMVFPRYETEMFRFKETFHVKQDRCHNETMDTAVTKGLVGFFLYWGLVFYIFYLGLKKWKKVGIEGELMIAALLSSMASYIVQNQFSFGVVAITSLFWIMWAMTANVDAEDVLDAEGEIGWDDIPWLPVAGVAIAALLMLYLSIIQFRADLAFKAGKGNSDAGNSQEALLHFEHSVKLLPFEGGAVTHYGISALNSGQYDRALKIFEFGMQVDPLNADNFYITSRVYLMKSDWKTAIAFAEKALKIDPYYAEAHITLANAYERLGQNEVARAHYQQAAQINPELMEPKLKGAWQLINDGKIEAAFKVFQELMLTDPRNPSVHNGLGAIYLKRGERGRAREEFEQALQLNPADGYAQRALQWLK